jgi:hypothetical protein
MRAEWIPKRGADQLRENTGRRVFDRARAPRIGHILAWRNKSLTTSLHAPGIGLVPMTSLACARLQQFRVGGLCGGQRIARRSFRAIADGRAYLIRSP